jgi:Cation transporting ATPase, C-terminus
MDDALPSELKSSSSYRIDHVSDADALASLNDMGTDSLTALGLGMEAPDPQVMQQPPRSRSERLFD